MTSSESLRPLEELKKRHEEILGGNDHPVSAAIKLNNLIDKVFALAEIYRDLAAGDHAENYTWADSEASRLFKGEDGV